jgi:cytochrome c553
MTIKFMRALPRVASIVAAVTLAVTASVSYADDAENAKALTAKLAPKRAQNLATQWCSVCHGPGGNSKNPLFPVLAGQNSDYVVAQLKNFHNLNQDDRAVTHETMFEQWVYNITGWRKPSTSYVHSDDFTYENAPRNEERAWDFMKGVARDLDEPTMQALADFYAKQKTAAEHIASKGNAEAGKKLFMEGDADRGLLPCQMCHQPDGHGQGSIPRLAGQHADYVKLQLQLIKSGTRSVDQMAALLANLTDADFENLAAYVQSLD